MDKRSKVAVAVAAILGSVIGRVGPVEAQQATTPAANEDKLQEVVVTGLRRSLRESMDTKRDAIGVVDAISAEDIGKFPDSNLSEALQRITGISISRVNGEGALVTARGFGSRYNMVTLNGRMMPAADAWANGAGDRTESGGGTSRSFNFANLAAESISAVEVYKTGRADIATGGIGATIDVKTDRPLTNDSSGLKATLAAKAVHDDTVRNGNDITPEVSGLFSWVNEDRIFGVSLSGSKQKRESGAFSADVNDWRIQQWVTPGTAGAMELDPGAPVQNAPKVGQLYGLPNDLRYHYSDRKRDRTNGQLAVQFKPVDTLMLTTDYTYAENHLQENRGDQTLWFVRRASAVTFDTNQAVATPAMISENTGIGKDHGFEQQYRDQTNTLRSAGFNADWKVTDKFGLAFDYHDSTMKSLPTGSTGGTELAVSMAGPVVNTQTLYYNNSLPIMTYTLNDSRGNNNGLFDEADLGTQPMRVFYQDQTTEIKQGRIDAGLDFDSGGKSLFEGGRFQFGVETRAMDMGQKQSQAYFTLGDWGIAHPGEIPSNLVQALNLASGFEDFGHQGADPNGWEANASSLAAWAAQKYGVNLVNSTNWDQNNGVEEKTQAAYAQIGFNGEVADRKWHMLAGLRYETTDVRSKSDVLAPTAIRWTDNNDYFIDRATTTTTVTDNASYHNFLPAFDFDIELIPNVKGRFSYSKTIARAQYDQLRASVDIPNPGGPTLTGIQATATASNPQLVPLSSNNFDVSFEWYFAPQSYIAGGAFLKNVKNFIGSESVPDQFFGLRDATAGPRALAAQAAVRALPGHGSFVNETELFVMTALMEHPNDPTYTGGANGYRTVYVTGSEAAINQMSVDVATRYDIVANPDDPLYTFNTEKPVNNKSAKIHGFEIAGQHFFGETGFGVLANYTIVKGDVGFNDSLDPAAGNQFALLGLSDSANFVLMYEKYGFSARLAYNWRDKYLSDTNRGSFKNPVYVAPYEQVDASVNYNFTDNFAVSVEGLNITGRDIRQYGRSKAQLWYLEEQGARYAVGARYKF
jgi:TonB-dependent receptor